LQHQEMREKEVSLSSLWRFEIGGRGHHLVVVFLFCNFCFYLGECWRSWECYPMLISWCMQSLTSYS
jgi:hypothetical protein